MGKTMTLRGELDMQFGRSSTFGEAREHQIFQYESPDRQRGWRVKYACVWVQEVYNTGAGDGRTIGVYSLATDTLGPVQITDGDTAKEWLGRMGASDNRTIGWNTQDYQQRDNVDADFIMPTGGMRPQCEFILDEDRILTNQLWIQSYGLTEETNLSTKLNYYVVLEALKITPSESVLQQLKGMGQDV